jgi:hypothetical protein
MKDSAVKGRVGPGLVLPSDTAPSQTGPRMLDTNPTNNMARVCIKEPIPLDCLVMHSSLTKMVVAGLERGEFQVSHFTPDLCK